MSRLADQLQRLFGLADSDLTGQPDGARVLLIGIERPGDWATVAALYQGLQADLDLPAPALSISARAGFQIWLSLASPVAGEQASAFLQALARKYLAGIPVDRISLQPMVGEDVERGMPVPSFDENSGKWSAFIDPGMGSLFIDEPGLEIAPNPDRQADLLAGVVPVALADFQRALARLKAEETAEGGAMQAAQRPPAVLPQATAPRPVLLPGQQFADPRAFLLAVMNDPAASTKERIRAAKALLPYF